MATKRRLSVTVDADVVTEAEKAVRDGHAPNVSAYVEDALKQQLEKYRRLRAMDEFFRWYEAEHGVITEEDMEEAYREAQRRAIHVRPGRATAPASRASESNGPSYRPSRRSRR